MGVCENHLNFLNPLFRDLEQHSNTKSKATQEH